MRYGYRFAIFGLACLGSVLAAAPAAADFRREQKLALAPGGQLLVDAAGGSVTVTGGATEGATVVITSTRDDIEERYSFELTSEPGRARVISRRRHSGWFQWLSWSSNGNLHFDVRVPRQTHVDLKSSGGGIQLSGLTGNAKVRSSGGGLRIADVAGGVDASSSGGSVEVKQVRGEVRVSSSGGGVSVAQVTGDVTAESSGGGVEITGVSGNVEASSSGGGVHVNGAGGRVKAENSGGPVSAVLAAGNTAGGSLSSSGGGVRVSIAPDARLSIDASSSGGSVSCELPVQRLGKESRTALRGDLNGGGPVLKLRSSGGGIRIDANGG